jgi:hypothetical protein
MGCDFYIYVYLEIEHCNGISYHEFSTIRGYYSDLECGICDSDDDERDYYYKTPEYDALYYSMKKMCLTPRKPVIIYDKSFVSPKFEMKYLPVIQSKMNNKNENEYSRYIDTGTFTSMEQVIKITKKESRYDPSEYYSNSFENITDVNA